MQRFDAGARLGPYEILAPVASAGPGEVYRGRDDQAQQDVMIRVLPHDFAADPAALHRFADAMRPIVALTHPNILRIMNVGADARAAYIVSEPVAGETLQAILDRGSLPRVAALRMLAQITRAMLAARAKGVVHNDVQPEAIVIGADGHVTMTGMGMGRARPGLGAIAGLIGSLVRACEFDAAPGRRPLARASAILLLATVGVITVPRFKAVPEPRAIEGRVLAAPLSESSSATKSPSVTSEPGQLPEPDRVAPAIVLDNDALPHASVELVGAVTVAPPAVPEPEPVEPLAEGSMTVPAPSPATPIAIPADRAPASLLTEALVHATELDLAGAAALLSGSSDPDAQVAFLYIRGLIDAREAARQGGSPESLAPVRHAIASLEAIAQGRPGSAEIARLMLQAAAAAAQSERDEMRLYLETAVRMEMLHRAAGLPGAPLVPAAETAGDLWLQVHRYDEARTAYADAAERFGPSLRIAAGRARAARGANDVRAACTAFRTLLDAWGDRTREPIEIREARAYIAGSCPSR